MPRWRATHNRVFYSLRNTIHFCIFVASNPTQPDINNNTTQHRVFAFCSPLLSSSPAQVSEQFIVDAFRGFLICHLAPVSAPFTASSGSWRRRVDLAQGLDLSNVRLVGVGLPQVREATRWTLPGSSSATAGGGGDGVDLVQVELDYS